MDDETKKAWQILIGGSVITQVAVCRFLIQEGVIDRQKLVAWVDGKRQLWEQSAGPAGGGAARLFLTGIASEREPEFPKTMH
jgi:hypothetical protein